MAVEVAWSQGTQAPSSCFSVSIPECHPQKVHMAHHHVTWACIQPAASGQRMACSVFEGKAWQLPTSLQLRASLLA